MQIVNETNKNVIASNAKLADTFLTRMIGLLNLKSFTQNEGLIITKCQSIHMLFMKFAIDVIFVSGNNQVVGLVENIKPYRLSKIYWKASYAVEVPVGAIAQSKTKIGDLISWE